MTALSDAITSAILVTKPEDFIIAVMKNKASSEDTAVIRKAMNDANVHGLLLTEDLISSLGVIRGNDAEVIQDQARAVKAALDAKPQLRETLLRLLLQDLVSLYSL